MQTLIVPNMFGVGQPSCFITMNVLAQRRRPLLDSPLPQSTILEYVKSSYKSRIKIILTEINMTFITSHNLPTDPNIQNCCSISIHPRISLICLQQIPDVSCVKLVQQKYYPQQIMPSNCIHNAIVTRIIVQLRLALLQRKDVAHPGSSCLYITNIITLALQSCSVFANLVVCLQRKVAKVWPQVLRLKHTDCSVDTITDFYYKNYRQQLVLSHKFQGPFPPRAMCLRFYKAFYS